MAAEYSQTLLSTNFFISNPSLHFHSHKHSLPSKSSLKLITTCFIPAKPPPANLNLHQPFRPPPSKFQSLDTAEKIDILSNRLGLWYEYASFIPSLVQKGLNPPSIEEAIGISGVKQNRLIISTRVWESLIESGTDPDVVAEFETGGAELLYEI